ncbi:MAG: glycoside hydrolase family 31 protein [Rhodocyclaceae bacterium]
MPEITRRQTWLTGRPAFTPRWSLGYSGSTMAYTDAPDAQTRMDDFLKDCREHDIPCDSFHLSSGYTSIDGRRYVFNWNRKKFPDPKGFVQKYLDHGVKLCPNIKPCLLHDHPRFEEARAAGLFIHQPDGSPDTVQFWDEAGALLDFTNPATRQWWRARVKDSLLDYGIAATWNDNNEFEVLSRTALAHGVDAPFPAREAKPLHTLLMLKSSRRAQQEHAPHERPYLVSRAGAAGMQRYVQTWSGDNYTSWETLRYNIKMALGLAMSGVSNTGHDIGGFSGPRPSPELFLRWVQHGIFLPRFSIHSWNDDGTANEPWMYPAITHHIRDLIQLRYRLLPYLYDLLWRSHSDYVPIIQPTHYAFPDDARCFDDNDDMLLGDRLLVASVVEEGASMRRVYLPAGTGWYDWWLGDYYDGGQDIELSAPWNHPPLLVREGAIVPLNIAEQHFGQAADERAFAIFPTRGIGRQVEVCFEDDGQSQAYRQGQHGAWQVTVGTDSERVTVEVVATGTCPPVQRELTLLLPPQEARRIDLQAGRYLSDRIEREWRCVRIAFD